MGSKTSPPPGQGADPRAETRSRAVSEESEGTKLVLVVSFKEGVVVVALPDKDTVILGRAPECDVMIDDVSVSRQHARIRHRDGRLTIEDCGSSNGTRVDEKHLATGDQAFLRIGSTFEVGSTTIVVQRARGLLQGPSGVATRPPPKRPSRPPGGEDGPVVEDPAMLRLYGLLDVLAPSPLAILILGETGAGKEIFAEAVHQRSNRPMQPFLQLNCASLPESILEGELFGYERGAFTGAAQAKAGLFESADGGTVFLDEVGEIPMTIQAKLLRVLESGEVMRLGALKPKRVDVRFVSATNRDLRALIVNGRFRADLYFRLNGTSLTLPPLRARVVEIHPLARLFASRTARRVGRGVPEFTQGAIEALHTYTWPGNIRELRNVVERAVVMCGGGAVSTEHLALNPDVPRVLISKVASSTNTDAPRAPLAASFPGAEETGRHASLRLQIESIEKQSIIDALVKTAGNQSHAAKILGLARSTFLKKLELYGIARPRKGREG